MNMILGDVEETITVVDVDEITQAQSLRVSHVCLHELALIKVV